DPPISLADDACFVGSDSRPRGAQELRQPWFQMIRHTPILPIAPGAGQTTWGAQIVPGSTGPSCGPANARTMGKSSRHCGAATTAERNRMSVWMITGAGRGLGLEIARA